MKKRTVDYRWRLAELTTDRGLHITKDLVPLLAERGISISQAGIYRLVNQPPARVSLNVIVALCDIFECTPADLLIPVVAPTGEVTATTEWMTDGPDDGVGLRGDGG